MFKKIQKFIGAVNKQEFARASIYYVIANIIGQGVVLLSSAVFTRMMSKTDYGLVSTYSTWVLVLNTFICLNLFVSVRTAYVDFRNDYENYVSSVLMLVILCGIAMTTVLIAINVACGMHFGLTELLFACIQSVSLNVINYMLAVQSMKNEYRQRTVMMVAPNWTHIVLSVVLMFVFTHNLYIAKIAGNALGLLVFGIICSVFIFSEIKPRIISKYWMYSLKISVPSIFHTLSDLILMQCDRLMLTSISGAEETAEYTIVYNVSSIIVAIYQAINGAWLPWFFGRLKKNDEKNAKRYQEYYILIFTVFSCGMMTIAPELIKIMSPENYWKGIRYVAPIVVASYLIFLYAFFSAYLLYMKRTVRIAVNTIIAAALNVILNYFLIPRYNAEGAVAATVISYTTLFILHYVAIKRDGRNYFCIKKMWLYIAIMSGYGIIFYWTEDMLLLRYGLFILMIVLLYMFFGKRMVAEIVEGRR